MKQAVVFWCLASSATALAAADDITPRVGTIEIYGNRKVSNNKIKSALEIKEGDPPPSRQDTEDRIDKISGILASRIQATCCNNNKLTLYVGVEERDAARIEFHDAPSGDVKLSDDMVDAYHAFIDAVTGSIRDDSTAQDLTNGYSLMQSADANAIQHRFLPLAERDLALLDQVVRNSADVEQRTIAAYMLQYAPRGVHASETMVNALQWALQDAEDSVRENAMRSLKAVEVGARLHPDQAIRLQPTWFIELLNSPVWSDRRNASLALVTLTDKRQPETLQRMRERALPSILEMAKWQDLRDALPPFILAGRMADLSEEQIKQAWVSGDREAVITQALSPKKKFHILPKAKT